jgi:hypothetical protein
VHCGDCAQGSSGEHKSETEVEEDHNHEDNAAAIGMVNAETLRREKEEASDQSRANQVNQERLTQTQLLEL